MVLASMRFRRRIALADGDGEADFLPSLRRPPSPPGYRSRLSARIKSWPLAPHVAHSHPPFHACSGQRRGRCWPGHRAGGPSARRHCRQAHRSSLSGHSPALPVLADIGGGLPPWPVRRSRSTVESRSMVNGASPGPEPAMPGTTGGSAQQLFLVLLTNSGSSRKLLRKVPLRCCGALAVKPSTQAVPFGAQHISVVDAISAGLGRRPFQGHQPVSVVRLRPARRRLRGASGETPSGSSSQGKGGWKDQLGIGHLTVVVEPDLDPVQLVTW